MLKRAQALFLGLLSPVIALVMAGSVSAESAMRQLNMPQGVTEVSQAAYDIHMIMMWICTVIGIAVFGFMFYVMYAHRKSRGAVAANFHENHVVELIWTIVPALILIVMAIPATSALLKVYDTENADIDIKVTGYQWKWQYEYIGEGVKYMSELRTSQDEIYGRAPKGEHYIKHKAKNGYTNHRTNPHHNHMNIVGCLTNFGHSLRHIELPHCALRANTACHY